MQLQKNAIITERSYLVDPKMHYVGKKDHLHTNLK